MKERSFVLPGPKAPSQHPASSIKRGRHTNTSTDTTLPHQHILTSRVAESNSDVEITHVEDTTINPESGLEKSAEEFSDHDDEVKPKLALRLKYQDFTLFGRCLCVIVEPWPPIHAVPTQSATPVAQPSDVQDTGATSSTPRSISYAKTPLFYPDSEDDDNLSDVSSKHSGSPLATQTIFSNISRGDRFDGIIQFSQSLNATHPAAIRGNMEEDDEIDGAVFFADADEAREL